MATEQPDEHADLEEAEDLVERRRLESILDAREHVRRARQKLKYVEDPGTPEENAKLTQDGALRQIARSTKAYIRELQYPLSTSEAGQKYWENESLGIFELDPPDPADLAWDHKDRHDIGTTHSSNCDEMPRDYDLLDESDRDPKVFEVMGLKSYLNLDPKLEIEHSADFHIRFRGTETITIVGTHPVPEHISVNAYEAANQFLGELDLDIGAISADREAGFDIKDINQQSGFDF